jgi:uncharacterized protein (DUF1499 family)
MFKVGFLILLCAVVLITVFMAFRLVGEASKSQSMAPELGVVDGTLIDCPNSPNCVSSRATDDKHGVDAITDVGGLHWTTLVDKVSAMVGARLVTNQDDYMWFEFSTSILGFVDDVEFLNDPANGQISVRSASRVGYSDFGANRKRIETIRAALNAGH